MTAAIAFLTQPPVLTHELRDALSVACLFLGWLLVVGIIATVLNPEKTPMTSLPWADAVAPLRRRIDRRRREHRAVHDLLAKLAELTLRHLKRETKGRRKARRKS